MRTEPTMSSAVSMGMNLRTPSLVLGTISGLVRPSLAWTSCSTGSTATDQRSAPRFGAMTALSPRKASGLGKPAAKSFIRRFTRDARRSRATNSPITTAPIGAGDP